MDMSFSRVRFAALETLVDAFKNTKVKVLYVASVLGFLGKLQAQGDGQEQQSTQAMHDLEVQHSQDDEQNGALRLPGCAKPTYMGKHPAEVRSADGCTRIITKNGNQLCHVSRTINKHLAPILDMTA